jgi:E3 ubiquitin-protein ligase BIG BROTHER-like protein
MATPTTYSVRVSSETHKIEAWVASDEALARQLQEEENARDAAADTREFAGTAPLAESFPSSEVIPLIT